MDDDELDQVPRPKPLKAKPSSPLARLDDFAAHLNRCMQTPAGVDTVLLLLCYSTRLSAAVINSTLNPSPRIMSLFMRLLAPSAAGSSSKSSSGSKAVVKSAPSTIQLLILRILPRIIPRLAQLATRLKTLSALTSDARTFTRLWSLLGLYLWARRLSTEEGTNGLDRLIGWTQVISCVGLSVLENGAFLSHRKVMGWSPTKQAWAYRWSTRFWTAYVAVELGKLALERVRVMSKRADEVAVLSKAKEGEDESQEVARRAEAKIKEQEHWMWEDRWRGNLLRNLAWAPLTVHWGLEKGLVSETALSMLGCIPGVVQTRQLWKDTAA
jgi:hypothetical protein